MIMLTVCVCVCVCACVRVRVRVCVLSIIFIYNITTAICYMHLFIALCMENDNLHFTNTCKEVLLTFKKYKNLS